MIHYKLTGQGQAVVLIHGFPNDSSTWETISPKLQQQYRLFLPDLPGAGSSPAPDTAALSMAMMAEEIAQMLTKEGVDKAILVGHSMGGYVAMEFASRYPERVLGISLVHSLANADNEEKKANRKKAISLMSKGNTEQETFLRGMAQNLFAASFAKAHPHVVSSVVTSGMKISPTNLAAFYTAIMHRQDHQEVLRQATFPVQWIIGDEDTATRMEDALKQAHLAAVNKVSVYSPCGHMSMLEHPDRLADDVMRFFNYCTQQT